MTMKKQVWGLFLALCAGMCFMACGGTGASSSAAEKKEAKKVNSDTHVLTFKEDGTWDFDSLNQMRSADTYVVVNAPEGAEIYYTMNGTNPDEKSARYTEKLLWMPKTDTRFPDAYNLRVRVRYADGTWSKVAARTFFVAEEIDKRFTTMVVSVSGDAAELTNKPDGILYGNNAKKRGAEYEREAFTEMWDKDGNPILAQFIGVRAYGGASREAGMKSMKLFSRSSYDPDHKNFKISVFETVKEYDSEKVINTYDKLVLRNSGNDFQFGFIRDEFSQTLAKQAGFVCYEGVEPAVVYLNGSYYGLFWLHENYCDTYFKQKFGKAEGKFYILEGSDRWKSQVEDADTQKLVEEFNAIYKEYSELDLTIDAYYNDLNSLIDVEDYLTYFAWNVAIGNDDWPQNNMKCYRYVEASADKLSAEDAVKTPDSKYFDGRYRFLPHDMDFTWGLYGDTNTNAKYDHLEQIVDSRSKYYSPLFIALMKRPESREFFRNKVIAFSSNILNEENLRNTYYELDATRKTELMSYYYNFIEIQKKTGETDYWTFRDYYAEVEKRMLEFFANREANAIHQLNLHLPSLMK